MWFFITITPHICAGNYISVLVHSNLSKVIILPTKKDHSHIYFDDLVRLKIPALSERGTENNRLILKTIALNGPMLKYRIFKNVQVGRYSTVSRRVDSLTKTGYLGEASKRATERGKRTEESMYGLTWRGFIASITINEVRGDIFRVLESNPLLAIPEKETALVLLKEMVTREELATIGRSLLEAFLKSVPSLEFVENEPMSILAWLLSIKERPVFPDGFKLSRIPKDAWELLGLLDRPTVLGVVKEKIVPLVREKTMEIEALYQLLSAANKFCDFVSSLQVEDEPSKRVREYLEGELKMLSEDPNTQKFLEEE